MIVTSNIVGILADDLTGANDTALQFHIQGANTQILLSNDIEPLNIKNTQTWAVSTESRNISQEEAFQAVKSAADMLIQKINPDYLKSSHLQKSSVTFLLVYILHSTMQILLGNFSFFLQYKKYLPH